MPLLDALAARPVAGKVGRPRRKPDLVLAERAFAHMHNFRRLRTRYERTPEVHLAFLTLACAILCWRRLESL